MSLLCVPFNNLERLIYARVEPIIGPFLQQEQGGFQHGRSTKDQVILLTQDIEDSFSVKKAGADLTAVCDTVWHRGVTCKLLRLLHDIHRVCMIMEVIGNRSFTLTTCNGKRSRLRRLKTASYRDLSWHPFPSTSTSLTCQPRLQRGCIGWRPSNCACWWWLEGSGKGAEQGHGNHRWAPPDLAAEVQHYKNGVGNLPPQQQGSQTWAKCRPQQRSSALLLRTQIPRSNVGQVAHVSPTPWVTLQKVDITRPTLEVTFWLWPGCWSNNIANSHLSPGAFTSRALRFRLVPMCSHLPHWPRHQRRLANCDWTPVSYTSRQTPYPRRHPTCWASTQRSQIVSSTPCYGTWTPAPHSAQLSSERECTASQIETPICTRRTTTHQFTRQ